MFPLPSVVRGSSESQNSPIAQFVVKSVSGDFLVCRPLSGTSSGSSDVYVARPYLLRRTIWSGQTRNGVTYTFTDDQTRSATTGGTAITEKVTPSYQANDVIYGAASPAGGIGSTGIMWLDINADGRSWAKST